MRRAGQPVPVPRAASPSRKAGPSAHPIPRLPFLRAQPNPTASGMRRSAYARRTPSAPHVPGGQAQGGNRDANGAEPLARLLLSSQIS